MFHYKLFIPFWLNRLQSMEGTVGNLFICFRRKYLSVKDELKQDDWYSAGKLPQVFALYKDVILCVICSNKTFSVRLRERPQFSFWIAAFFFLKYIGDISFTDWVVETIHAGLHLLLCWIQGHPQMADCKEKKYRLNTMIPLCCAEQGSKPFF